MKIRAADLFCGAGGTSAGLNDACLSLGHELDLVAVNHWPTAIETHSASHSFAEHICENLDNVDPRKVISGGKLDILVASPECTHFSRARCGKPKDDQSRASGWHVLRWAEALRPESVIVENVPEWTEWSPLQDNGKVDPSFARGHTFRGWVSALEGLGYRVDWRVFNCADFGDVTTRRRLFVMARKDGKIRWPEPTHSSEPDIFIQQRWKSARSIIDWEDEGSSVFGRKRSISPSTMKRIRMGVENFCGVTVLDSDDDGFVIEKSSDTVMHPLVVQIDNHSSGGHNCRLVDDPISTIVSKQRHCLVQPRLKSKSKMDVKLRILSNDELAKAHGMEDFQFHGNTAEITKQIGNSVPRRMAKALCLAQLK